MFGIKPTLGRVPPYSKEWGGYGGWPTLSQAGPITRSVDDAALLLDVLAGPAPGDPFAIPPAPDSFRPRASEKLGLKIAWSPDLGFAAVDPEIRAICERAARSFADLGCQVEEADPGVAGDALLTAFGPLALGGDVAIHEDLLEAQTSEISDYTERFLRAGLKVSAAAYVRAEQLRTAIWQAFDEFLSRYDLLLTPTLATAAFPIGEPPASIDGVESRGNAWTPFTMACNLTGQPAASVPCGWTSEGLPVGLHVISRAFREKLILQAAHVFEQAHPWADRWPPNAEPSS